MVDLDLRQAKNPASDGHFRAQGKWLPLSRICESTRAFRSTYAATGHVTIPVVSTKGSAIGWWELPDPRVGSRAGERPLPMFGCGMVSFTATRGQLGKVVGLPASRQDRAPRGSVDAYVGMVERGDRAPNVEKCRLILQAVRARSATEVHPEQGLVDLLVPDPDTESPIRLRFPLSAAAMEREMSPLLGETEGGERATRTRFLADATGIAVGFAADPCGVWRGDAPGAG